MPRTEKQRQAAGDHARETLARCGIDPREDFHALPGSAVDALLEAADRERYRKPRNANGSRARYYHAMLVRRARWYSDE